MTTNDVADLQRQLDEARARIAELESRCRWLDGLNAYLESALEHCAGIIAGSMMRDGRVDANAKIDTSLDVGAP